MAKEEISYEDQYGNPVPPPQPQPQPQMMPGIGAAGMAAGGYPYPMDSGLFDAFAREEIQNSRQFYLAYEELLEELEHFWKGEYKTDNGWKKRKSDKNGDNEAIMSDKAARVLISLLKGSLSRVIRLTNFEGEDVKRLAYQSRERIAGWLATEGWLKYQIPVSYLPIISHSCEMLTYSSLLWGKNAGGQRFMNTSIRSMENVSQVFQEGAGQTRNPGEDSKKWFPKFKLF